MRKEADSANLLERIWAYWALVLLWTLSRRFLRSLECTAYVFWCLVYIFLRYPVHTWSANVAAGRIICQMCRSRSNGSALLVYGDRRDRTIWGDNVRFTSNKLSTYTQAFRRVECEKQTKIELLAENSLKVNLLSTTYLHDFLAYRSRNIF